MAAYKYSAAFRVNSGRTEVTARGRKSSYNNSSFPGDQLETGCYVTTGHVSGRRKLQSKYVTTGGGTGEPFSVVTGKIAWISAQYL